MRPDCGAARRCARVPMIGREFKSRGAWPDTNGPNRSHELRAAGGRDFKDLLRGRPRTTACRCAARRAAGQLRCRSWVNPERCAMRVSGAEAGCVDGTRPTRSGAMGERFEAEPSGASISSAMSVGLEPGRIGLARLAKIEIGAHRGAASSAVSAEAGVRQLNWPRPLESRVEHLLRGRP